MRTYFLNGPIANTFNIRIYILRSATDYILIPPHQRDTCFPFIIIYFANSHKSAGFSDELVVNALAYTVNGTISSSTRCSVTSPTLTSSSALVAATFTLPHINASTSSSPHAATALTSPHVNASISSPLHINASTSPALTCVASADDIIQNARWTCYNEHHNLSTIHHNVQCLLTSCNHAKLDHLHHILSLTNSPDIFCLSES